MFSLIVCTLGRVQEVDRLLASLETQTYKEIEVLLVDQNHDDLLDPVLRAHPNLEIRHLHSAPGLSRARNVGLRLARGGIIAIPDDDCWYPGHLLMSVSKWLDDNLDFDVLSTIKRSADNAPVGLKWPNSACQVTPENVWDSAISSTIFMRRSVTDRVGLFNEGIGVGAPSKYQSGEETDYLLRALEMGFHIWYEPTLTVHHPPLASIARLRKTTYPFALGMGYVLRVHGYSWRVLTTRFIRSFGGALFSVCKGDFAQGQIYLSRAAGQLQGYLFGPRDLRRLAESRRSLEGSA